MAHRRVPDSRFLRYLVGSMATADLLFDSDLRLRRAARRDPGAAYLLDRAAQELEDRLAVTLRPFPEVLDVDTPTPAFADAVRRSRPDARLSRAGLTGDSGLLADADGRPVAEASVDLVVSGLAWQDVDDLPGVLAQARRALRPDGLLLACLAGGRTLTELRQVLTEAEAELTGGVSPRVHPFADVRDMGGLLQRAGLALPVADLDSVTVRYPDMFALMADLRAMGAANTLAARLRRPTRRALFLRAAELYAQRFADPDGRVRATFETIWISGWVPHASQQKPLRPGSARTRLADVLGVTEHAAGDRAGQE
jgi:SAM-dependent methyltransferase